MDQQPKVALIGIDGACWEVIMPLIKKGLLPTFAKILKQGVHGYLRSTIPPVTGAAWVALATGLNPGKTGVLDFLKLNEDFVLKVVDSRDYYGKAVWDYLSLLGYRIIILDYPMLYPPYPINGIMVSSWGRRLSTYPADAMDIIKSITNDYDIFVDYHLKRYDDIELFLNELDEKVDRKFRVSIHFLRSEKWNLFVDILSFTDWLQHRMWHYIDPEHPMYPGDKIAFRYKKKFIKYWQKVDNYLREVVNIADHVFVVSDHGFGPQWGVFNLTKWLVRHGFTFLKRMDIKRRLLKLISSLGGRMRYYKVLPDRVKNKVYNIYIKLSDIVSQIDLKESKIIPLKYTIPFGAIHINPKFHNYVNEILKEIEDKLRNLDEELSKDLEVKIWRSHELYNGANVNRLPELIFTINDWSCVIIKDPFRDFVYLDAPYSPRHTGSHRLYGIFIAYGDNIKEGLEIYNANIYDITPTILYLFYLPIPKNVDGRVLKEIFSKDFKIHRGDPVYVDPFYYNKLRVKQKLGLLRKH